MKKIVRLFHGEELLVGHVALALRVEAKLPLILHDVAVLLGVKLEVLLIGEQLSPRLLCLLGKERELKLLLLFVGQLGNVRLDHHLLELVRVLELKVRLHEREADERLVLGQILPHVSFFDLGQIKVAVVVQLDAVLLELPQE